MGKTAFLFAGQGAQAIGMGKDLGEAFPEANSVFEQASDSLGYDIKKLIFDGDSETLMITENTQPAILTMSAAALRVVESAGISADYVMGLSLGEYTAHVASGSLDFGDAAALVRKRGRYMQEEVPLGVGGMAAIIGLSPDDVRAVCTEASSAGIVEPANFNCPGQVSIAGEKAAVERACEIAKEKGAKRAVMLAVSAPVHCSMLRGAGEKLAKELENVTVGDMKIPVFSNVTVDIVPSKEDIKPYLIKQVSSSVLFESGIRKMLDLGVDTFIEIGPGKALSGFVKRVTTDVKIFNVDSVANFEKLKAELDK